MTKRKNNNGVTEPRGRVFEHCTAPLPNRLDLVAITLAKERRWMCCCRVVIVVCLQGSAAVRKGLLSCVKEGVGVVVVKEIGVGAVVVVVVVVKGIVVSEWPWCTVRVTTMQLSVAPSIVSPCVVHNNGVGEHTYIHTIRTHIP